MAQEFQDWPAGTGAEQGQRGGLVLRKLTLEGGVGVLDQSALGISPGRC